MSNRERFGRVMERMTDELMMMMIRIEKEELRVSYEIMTVVRIMTVRCIYIRN